MARRLTPRVLIVLCGIAIFSVLPFVMSRSWTSALVMFFVYGCIGYAFNLILGHTGQISLAQTLFFGVGCYTPVLLFSGLGLTPWVGMWVGGAVSIVLAIFLGYICFRYGIRGGYFALVSLAFSQIALALVTTFEVLGGARELNWDITYRAIDFQFPGPVPFYFVGMGMLVTIMLVSIFVMRTKWGYYFRAIRENEYAAQATGINVVKYKVISLSLSALLTSFAGTLFAQYVGTVLPDSAFGFSMLITMMLVAVIGGLGTDFGPLVGALFLVLVSTLLRWYAAAILGLDVVIYSVILIVATLGMPQGIMGIVEGRITRGQVHRELIDKLKVKNGQSA